jgi:hypothetical protein
MQSASHEIEHEQSLSRCALRDKPGKKMCSKQPAARAQPRPHRTRRRTLVYERLIDNERRGNAAGLFASLNMLIMTDGGFDYSPADRWGGCARQAFAA